MDRWIDGGGSMDGWIDRTICGCSIDRQTDRQTDSWIDKIIHEFNE